MAETKLIRDHHLLTRNLKLNDNYISNDGGDEGISIDNDGIVTVRSQLDIYDSQSSTTMSLTHNELDTTNNDFNLDVGIGTLTLTSSQSHATQKHILIDKNFQSLSTATSVGLLVDYTDIAATNFGATTTNIALDIDLISSAPTKLGVCNNYGIDIDLVAGTSGSQTNYGLDISCTGADVNYAIRALSSHAQLALYYDASSAATFTVTDGSHLTIATFITETGDITLDANGDVVLDANAGNIYFKDNGVTYIDFQVDGSDDKMVVTGDLTIDASGDITLDAAGDNIKMLGSGGSGLDFIQSGTGDYTIKNLTSDKDIIFNVNDNTSDTEVMRLDGSASSLFIASGKEIQFGDVGEYIYGNGTSMWVVSSGILHIQAGQEIDFNTTTCGFTAQTGTDAVSIDWGEGNKYHLLLETSSTVTFATNPTNPCNLLLKVQQGNGGSKIITWAVTSGTIYWPGGGILDTDKPTLTTADDETDILSFYFDGTNYFGVASLGFDTPSP